MSIKVMLATITCPCGCSIDVELLTDSPAQHCQNHDSYFFGTPGDGPEITEMPDKCPECAEALDYDRALEQCTSVLS